MNPRIPAINSSNATPVQQQLLDAVKTSVGRVPNLVATMMQSPVVARAYLAFSRILSDGMLSPKLREQIALAVSEANSCRYCLSAHTSLAARAGLSEVEILDARHGTAAEPRDAAAIAFARKIIAERGLVRDEDVAELREEGLGDGEIAEIVANTALSLFTNYFNHVAGTTVDFPEVPALEGCSCKG